MTLTAVLRRASSTMRLPSGFGILFDTGTRWRLLACIAGAVLSAALDMLGVLALLPLMQLLTNADRDSGILGAIDRMLGGGSSDAKLTGVIASVMIAAFIAKAVTLLSFRWWQMNFIATQEAATAVRLLSGYLGAPYATFVRRSQAEFMRTLSDAVTATYNNVVVAGLGMLAEVFTLGALAVVLLLTSPLAAVSAIIWFACTLVPLNRFVRRRSGALGELSLNQKTRLWGALVHPVGGAKEIMLRHNADASRRSSARPSWMQPRLGFGRCSCLIAPSTSSSWPSSSGSLLWPW